MRTQYFSLRLLSNTIISQSSATSGDHESLDFIPGSVLLGLAAGRLYPQLGREQADQLFQSQHVRFGDALPSAAGELAYPVPLCWHHVKGMTYHESREQGRYLCAERIFDPSRKGADPGLQPKQLRAGHVTTSGALLIADKDYELKTAINPRTGGAAQSQLFGYQSLRAGQEFIFALNVDSALDERLFAQLCDSLSGRARLGRSRSAQFGQAVIQPIAAPKALASQHTGTELRLWLLSDLALFDDYGNPMLTPTAAAFGLPEGSRWCAKSSFIRTRSYTPFNAKRRCYDLQRQLISRGSVLVFKLPESLSPAALEKLRFVGQHQNAGLGQIAVNPALLASANPGFGSAPASAARLQPTASASDPDTRLSRFLQRKLSADGQGRDVERRARQLVSAVLNALHSAAGWAGLPANQFPPETPVRSQWGQLRQVAQAGHDGQTLRQQLFEGEHAVVRDRAGQASWGLQVNASEQLHDCLRSALQAIPDELLGQVLAHACTQLMSDKRLTQAEEER